VDEKLVGRCGFLLCCDGLYLLVGWVWCVGGIEVGLVIVGLVGRLF
jgi:hypothetical protein